ncbi:MAG TPA: hypothetical protein VGC05_18075 [Mycobacterium sp.]|jgi:hypothetical protein
MSDHSDYARSSRNTVLGIVSWSWVGIPLLYGVYELLVKIPALFTN